MSYLVDDKQNCFTVSAIDGLCAIERKLIFAIVKHVEKIAGLKTFDVKVSLDKLVNICIDQGDWTGSIGNLLDAFLKVLRDRKNNRFLKAPEIDNVNNYGQNLKYHESRTNILFCVFPMIDYYELEKKVVDGIEMEPLLFCPIIPLNNKSSSLLELTETLLKTFTESSDTNPLISRLDSDPWFTARFDLYERRKKKLSDQLAKELIICENKKRFFCEIEDGSIKLSKLNKRALTDYFKNNDYYENPRDLKSSYDYLLSIPLSQFNSKSMDKKISEIKCKISTNDNMDPIKYWVKDLQELKIITHDQEILF